MDDTVDAVVAAAVLGFAFVFIHPFLDGNGRIHRWLIHHVLARRGFGPLDVILPVSSVIVRDRRGYDEVLASFSRAIAPYVEWTSALNRALTVTNETVHLYRTFDATRMAEYTFDKLRHAIDVDLAEELDFLDIFDRALRAVERIVDLPDRRARDLVQFVLQNDGRLAARKRQRFSERSDEEIAALESAIRCERDEEARARRDA